MKISQYTILQVKLPVIAAFIISFITSCIPHPNTSYYIQQSIRLSTIEKKTLEKSSKKYHIYKLPYLQQTNYTSFLQLSVILDDVENLESFKEKKGYFAVIVNASEHEENVSNYIQRYTHSSSYLRYNQPFVIEKRISSADISAQKAAKNPKEKYDELCEIDSRSCITTSTRSFLFNYDTQNSNNSPPEPVDNTKLYKKIDFHHEGQDLYFAFWVENGEEEKLKELELKENLKELYKKLYEINDNHIWGYHNFDDYVVGDSIIHIGFGNITNKGGSSVESILGFVNFCTLFYKCEQEKITAPTIYMNIDTINKPFGDIKIYSTLVHELQHLFTHYQKRMQQSSSINDDPVNVWINETLSTGAQYLIEKDDIAKKYPEKFAQYKFEVWYKNSEKVFLNGSLTNNKQFTHLSYKIAYMLVTYLEQNYGKEVIEHALQNSYKNSYALVRAVKNSAKYQQMPAHLQPHTIEDILVQFFTAIFISDLTQDLPNTSHNYKFSTKLKKDGKIFNIAPKRKISQNNIIFEAKSSENENPSYTLQDGKYGVVYLGGKLSKEHEFKQGVLKRNEEGFYYFTLNLTKRSAVNLVIEEY